MLAAGDGFAFLAGDRKEIQRAAHSAVHADLHEVDVCRHVSSGCVKMACGVVWDAS